MNSTLKNEKQPMPKKSLKRLSILVLFAIAFDLFVFIMLIVLCNGYFCDFSQFKTTVASLNETVSSLEAENTSLRNEVDMLAARAADLETAVDWHSKVIDKFSDSDIWGYSEAQLFEYSLGKYYKIKDITDLKCRYEGQFDEEYTKDREAEWTTALRDAVSTNDELKSRLQSELALPDCPAEFEGEEAPYYGLNDEGFAYILDHLRLTANGAICYYYGEENRLYVTNCILRKSAQDSELGSGLYLFALSINY